MKVSIKALAALLALGGAMVMSSASAALIDHGAYFTDTRADQDWLKLDATAGQTYTSVENGFGGYVPAGWRIASPVQLLNLFVSAGAPDDGFAQIAKHEYGAPAKLLVGLFGVTVAGQDGYGWSSGMTSLAAGPGEHYINIIQYNGDSDGTGYLSATWRPQKDNAPIWGGGGAFLVRSVKSADVPEPASIALLGLGAAGLFAVRRYKTAK